MSPTIRRRNKPSTLQSAHSRQEILSKIAEQKGIPSQVEAEYIKWSIPKSPSGETKGQVDVVKINLLGLCSPGATLFEPTPNSTSSGVKSPDRAKQHFSARDKLSQFTATTQTRCVRDIKRIFAWKIYGVSYNLNNEEAHYVRVSFVDRQSDRIFSMLADLLDAIVAKRHVALDGVRPFGVGVDCGVPEDHNRIYVINNCAKQTPFVRKVTVNFEIYLENEWQRLEPKVDRFGFATYKSVDKNTLLRAAGPEDVVFTDDPYVRLARLTLRFGDRAERAFLDIENGERAAPYVSKSRKGSVVYLPRTRIRVTDGIVPKAPVVAMTRLIFRERDSGFLRGNNGRAAEAEADKLTELIIKTNKLAAKNTLGIHSSVRDEDIVPYTLGGIVSQAGFVIRGDDQITRAADIAPEFDAATMYAVPRGGGSSGITLVSQSPDGAFVLRQHIENPVGLIAAITWRGFNVSSSATLITTRTRTRYTGTGTLRYKFVDGEKDAEALVSRFVNLLNSIDAALSMPSRLPLLTKVLAQKQRLRALATATHSRSASNVSNFSDTSNVSVASASSSDNEKYELVAPPPPEIFEAPGDLGGVELEVPAYEMPAGKLARARITCAATLPREVDVHEAEIVAIEYKNDHWCFVRIMGGEEGWVPTSVLDVRE